MRRAATALLGAVAGGIAGGILLVTTHPTSAYTNDAYRQGASFGFVLRYVVLGLAAALLLRVVLRGGRGRGRVLAAVGLAIVLAVAIVPPALDEQTASEKRRAEATAIEDPDERRQAELRAGAIDGCVEQSRKDLAGVPGGEDIDVELYCECFIGAVVAGPRDDEEQLRAMAQALRAGALPPRLQRAYERCTDRAGA